MISRGSHPGRKPPRPPATLLPKTDLRPETTALTPRQLVHTFPHVNEDEYETYSVAHRSMLACAEMYDRCHFSRSSFWQHEQTLREVVQMLDPPPPYEP